MDEKTAPILIPAFATGITIVLMGYFVTDGWAFWPRFLVTIPALLITGTVARFVAAKFWPVSG